MDPPPISSPSFSPSFQPHHQAAAKRHDDDYTAATLTSATTKSHHPPQLTAHQHMHASQLTLLKQQSQHQQVQQHDVDKSSKRRSNNSNHHYKSRSAAKIIKGEIHNVCLTMRSDPRYYYHSNIYNNGNSISSNSSDTRTASAALILQRNRFDKYYDGDYCHPILSGLRRLHDLLSVLEVDGIFSLCATADANNCSSGGGGNIIPSESRSNNKIKRSNKKHNKQRLDQHQQKRVVPQQKQKHHTLSSLPSSPTAATTITQINAVTFVSPFTNAVCSSDITAKTTGAALGALHKFILYGFIGGNCHDHDGSHQSQYGGEGEEEDGDCNGMEERGGSGVLSPFFSSSSDSTIAIGQSITLIAECIRKCSFDDYSCYWDDELSSMNHVDGSTIPSNKGVFSSFWSRSPGNDEANLASSSNKSISNIDSINNHELPAFLTQPQRQNVGKGGNNATPVRKKKNRSTNKMHNTKHQLLNEDAILKLLSLSVQVLRCPAGRQYLSPKDVVGIFDKCLHVAIVIAAGENNSLLRSAAADALSHCVIVVFGMRGGGERRRRDRSGNSHRHDGKRMSYYYDNNIGDDDSDSSNDDWGERDPTEERTNDCSSDNSDDVEDDDLNETTSHSSNVEETGQREDSDEVPSKEEVNKIYDEDDDEPALVPIMHRLATLSDPLIHEDDTCVLALSLINIALETMSDVDALAVRYPRLLKILQNMLCRNLLRLSTSNDLTILGLALRVIFNLFNGIKDHLKVQLEVFLTSVHLRILSFTVSPQTHERLWACSPERRELALESLLEFCREPMLMADLYLNYDCDMNCTNLFETICATLSKLAYPEHNQDAIHASSSGNGEADFAEAPGPKPQLNILNRLALEGILAVIDSIARRCRPSSKFAFSSSDNIDPTNHSDPLSLPSPPTSGNSAFIGSTLYIRSDDQNESFDLDYYNEHVLRERKIQKRRLAKAAAEFNERSRDKEWIHEVERVGVLPTPATPSSVALFLYSTPKLDKTKIGLYLSKGPKDKYPFNNKVLDEFASLFDFEGMSFSDALRSFLSRFRLPGEAQCIDRLMESFANRLYEVSRTFGPGGDNDQAVEKTMLDPPCTNEPSFRSGSLDPPTAAEEEVDVSFPFRSADAAFILSFSTIMLNTDLHNPNMKDEKRMTLEQFIRNNRGINDGADLPVDFLTNLYQEIKEDEIQVKQDLLQDGVKNFEGLLAKASDVAQPFFTPSNSAYQPLGAGIHERDMFVAISSAAIEAISTAFIDSWDDTLVVKALDGLRNCAFVAAFFGLGSLFNQVLEMMLGFGQDYVTSVATFMYSEVGQDKEFRRVESELAARDIPPLPQSFLRKLNDDAGSRSILIDLIDVDGSAAHRGLLSLNCALALSRDHLAAVDEAWPILLDVIFALREVRALPASLSDLDDFADSRGNPLPASTFARDCKGRVNAYRESLATPKQSEEKGFWKSLFGSTQSSTRPSNRNVESHEDFPLYAALERIGNHAQLDHLIAKTDDMELAKRILFAMFESMIPDEDDAGASSDPLFENNAVFVLELAARFLISNRNNATELYPIFLSKFELLLAPTTPKDEDSDVHNVLGLKFPYFLERIIVTILRSCIHFYDIESGRLRDELNRSLRLITQLPSTYIRQVSDRLGCGCAIILRGCFFLFDERAEDWSIIKSLLDLAAQEKSGRGFVFDGLASVIDSIDYTLPDAEEGNHSNELHLSQCGVEVIASLLLRYSDGSYEGDMSFRIPSMSYITKIYSYSQHFATSNDVAGNPSKHEAKLQEYEFERMVTVIYSDACLSQDGDVAKRGFESLQGVILSTKVESIPVVKWLDFLELVVSNSPSVSVQEARVSSLGLIGRLFLTLIPELSNDKENWSHLEDFTISSAAIVNENLRSGRATTLFETTVETITNVVNILSIAKEMSMTTAEGGGFCVWVSETLLYELEQVGACGGVANRPGL